MTCCGLGPQRTGLRALYSTANDQCSSLAPHVLTPVCEDHRNNKLVVGTPYHPLLPQATARVSRCMVGEREGAAAAAAAGEPFLLLPSQRRRTIHITQPGRINPVLYRQDWLIYSLSHGCTPYNKRYTYSIPV